jgi:hypothetical protein
MQPGQRVLFSNSGTLTDITIQMNDFDEGTYTPGITAAEDYIYIASSMPFNHKWIEVSTVNAETSALTVELWHNGAWESAVDLLDYTDVSGATFGQSGIIQFRPDIDTGGWEKEKLSTDVTGIASLDIYEMFWMRLSFSADPTAGMVLKYIGNRFSKDKDLYAEYPDLNNSTLKTAWESGKTTWDDQHVLAADYIIQKLITDNVIRDKHQVMDWKLFVPAAVHKTAELIYGGFGPSMKENASMARKAYQEAIALKYFNTDKTGDGVGEGTELRFTTQEMTR